MIQHKEPEGIAAISLGAELEDAPTRPGSIFTMATCKNFNDEGGGGDVA